MKTLSILDKFSYRLYHYRVSYIIVLSAALICNSYTILTASYIGMIQAGRVGDKRLACDDRPWDEKGNIMISHIYISFSDIISSVQFGYLNNGSLVLSETFGTPDVSFRVVKLSQNEYVTRLSGAVESCGRIKNLTFHTNLGKHGPIGCENSKKYSQKIEIDPAISDRSEFGGFFGSYNKHHLTSIGIYFNPNAKFSHTVVKREDI